MRNFFRRYVAYNFPLKLVSLVLACGLWLAVKRDPIAEVAVSVPIEFHHFPESLEIVTEHIPQAQVRVRGPERVIHQLSPDDVHVEIDLSGTKAGERTFDLTAQQVHEPRELEVIQVVPGQFRLSFDTRLTRDVNIEPRVTGNFAPGLRIDSVSANPSRITITGPRQRVEAVEAATTDPVDASGTMEHATFVTHTYVADPLVQVVRPTPVHVTVKMTRGAAGSDPGK